MELPVAAALKQPGEVFHAELTESMPPLQYSGREVVFAKPVRLARSKGVLNRDQKAG